MTNLKHKKLYFIIFLIAILGLSYPLYKEKIQGDNKPVLANIDEEIDNLFPHPNNTFYQMGIYLDTDNNIIYGNSILNTKNTSQKALTELWFTLYPNAFKNARTTPAPNNAYYAGFDDGWLEFTEVRVNGEEVSYNEEGVSAEIVLKQQLLPGEDIVVEINWIAKVPQVAYRFGTKNQTYMLGNFYPTLDVLGEEWHNSYNSLFGDPFCFHTANYLVRLNVPSTFDVAATGKVMQKLIEDTGRVTYMIEANKVRDFSLAVLHNYTQTTRDSGQTLINIYTPFNYENQALDIVNDAINMLNYYAYQFGSYPYEDFKIVFVPMQGFHGMEYTGLIFLRDEFLQNSYPDKQSEFILAHEIAHQWWYSLVGNDQLKEPWLDEGLASWSAYKFLGQVKGQKIPTAKDYKNTVNLAKELRDIYSTPEYYLTAYTGGEAFWFHLEAELGQEKVFQILRAYLAEYKYRIATTEDLFNLISREADQDMEEFLSKWFNP